MKTKKPYGYWTKERIIKSAKKFQSIKDWIENEPASCHAGYKKNIMPEATKHMEKLGNHIKRCVYLIKFKNTKIAYIGLTYNFEKRINDHIKDNKKIIKFVKKFGLKKLISKKLSDYISVEKAVKLEKTKIKEYKKKGYILLNIRDGGSIGGGDQRKWTFESIAKTTSKFMSFKEWREKDQNSYDAAHRLNLLNNEKVTGHLKKEIGRGVVWTPEKILAEAKKYNQAGLFAKKSSSAFQASLRLNLYKEISKIMCWRKNLSKIIRERRNYA
jgi:predicted GIY-YIG superfamily endonuclease